MIPTRHRLLVQSIGLIAMLLLISAGIYSLFAPRDEAQEFHFIRKSEDAIRFPGSSGSIDTGSFFATIGKEVHRDAGFIGRLNKMIYGFYPYWIRENSSQLPYELLTHVAYFSYAVNPETGGPLDVRGWTSTPFVDHAVACNAKPILVASNFGITQNETLLSSEQAKAALIDSLLYYASIRNAAGINIDFEAVPNARRESLTNFMQTLSDSLRRRIPNAHLSIDLPPFPDEAFDVEALAKSCDHLIVMTYDYYYAKSATAGPVAPLHYDSTWKKEHIRQSILSYLAQGIQPEKILLGIPFYGYDWETESDSLGAPAKRTGYARYYASIRREENFPQRRFDAHSLTSWLPYRDGKKWRQVWFEDSLSLMYKYRFVDSVGLGGIAIWALGYDGGASEIWDGIIRAFVRVDKIDFHYAFAFNPLTYAFGARGISNISSIRRSQVSAGDYALAVSIRDSIRSVRSWVVPIDLYNLLVVPERAQITLKVLAKSIPTRAKIYCELESRGRVFRTQPRILQRRKDRWIDYSFNLDDQYSSSDEISDMRSRYWTLKRIVLTAPGDSKALDIFIDDITTKTIPFSPENRITSIAQKENILRIESNFEGKEIRSIALHLFDPKSGRWAERFKHSLARKESFDDVIVDSVASLGAYVYRLLVTDIRRNVFLIDEWEFIVEPSMLSTVMSLRNKELIIPFHLPTKESVEFQLFASSGKRLLSSEKKYFAAGDRKMYWKSSAFSSLKQGVYHLRIVSPNSLHASRILVWK